MYDYQKKVKEQTEEIASLEKQMAAYAGDDSEEARAKIQQIKVDLESAREELEETEYDRYIQDQQTMLDELYEEYETILNERLDNVDALMEDMISEINANAGTISSTLEEQSSAVGINLSEEMASVWGEQGVDGTIAKYGEGFSEKLTSTNNTLGTISSNVASMIGQLNKIAGTKVEAAKDSNAKNLKEAQEPQKDNLPTPPEPPKQDTLPVQPEKTITVGGKINAGSARIYADSYGNGGGRQYFANDPIYTVVSENNGYLLVRHHKSSSGYAGWFKKSDVKAYASGKKRFSSDELAWTQEDGREFIVRPSDGAVLTPLAKGDSVLNAAASENLWKMANSPSEFLRDSLGIIEAKAPMNNGGQTVVEQNFENVVFSMPNVKNYEQLISQMQKDKDFERLIMSMTLDRIAGKSPLSKNKALRNYLC